MDLNYTKEEQAFRAEVRQWLDDTLPHELREKVRLGKRLAKADIELWHSLLNARGWLAPNWPRAYGGCEWNAVQRHIFEEEACLAHAPRSLPFGLSMLAPVLLAFGSEDQRQRFLPQPPGTFQVLARSCQRELWSPAKRNPNTSKRSRGNK